MLLYPENPLKLRRLLHVQQASVTVDPFLSRPPGERHQGGKRSPQKHFYLLESDSTAKQNKIIWFFFQKYSLVTMFATCL